jgi:long-subunit acyl-CoA synthetase (AMP-forming)
VTVPGAQYRVAPSVERVESLGRLLGDALVQHKSLGALIAADRKREASRLTYAEADALSRRVALRLQQAGVGPDERVAILMTNQPRWLLSAVAVFRRGAVLVPLDYKLETHDQMALLQHSQPRVLVVEWPIWRKLGPLQVPHVWVSEAPEGASLGAAQRWEDLPEGSADEVERRREDLAAIVYSSGTGGRPKGCMLTHGTYLAQLQGLLERFPMAPGDVYFSILPTNHAIDFMVGFVGPFVCGATVVHQRTLRPEMLRFTMQRYGVTHMAVVPLLLAAFERAVREKLDELPAWQRVALEAALALHSTLTETGPRPALAARLLAPVHAAFGGRLRLLICGGAFTERRLVEFFARLGIPVVVGYGLTEACTAVTVNAVHPLRSDTVGTPLRDISVRICHDWSSEAGDEAPPVFERQRENPRGVSPGRASASSEAGDEAPPVFERQRENPRGVSPGRASASSEAGDEAPPVFERQRENPRGVSPGRASASSEAGDEAPPVFERQRENPRGVSPGREGIGEVLISGPTLMQGYLDDPELTAETIRDGWLHTGDLGYFDASGHLHLVGRLKDVIVTPGGKNVHPEDVEFAFSSLGEAGREIEDVAVVTANALWPALGMTGEELVLVVRAESADGALLRQVAERNRQLAAYKRVSSVLCWNRPFPRTASMKLKRKVLIGELASATRREQSVRIWEAV